MVILQLIALLSLATITFQDLKERMVSWLLFPITGGLLIALHIQNSTWEDFLIFGLGNVILTSSILFLLWIYTKLLRKQEFLNVSFGLGDVLFLYVLALGFPTVTFIVLLALSLCFSVLAFIVLNYFVSTITVPLAGFMSIFLNVILIMDLSIEQISLYQL